MVSPLSFYKDHVIMLSLEICGGMAWWEFRFLMVIRFTPSLEEIVPSLPSCPGSLSSPAGCS